MGRPEAVQLPALALQNRSAEQVPFQWVFRLGEADAVAEDADGHIVGVAGMVEGQVHAEAVVAPVNVAAYAVLPRQLVGKRHGENRGRTAGANTDDRLPRRFR